MIYTLRKIVFKANKYLYFLPMLLNKICKIEKIDNSWIMDKKLNISYEINTDIGDNLYFKGSFERSELQFLASVIKGKKNPVLFDIGANIGLHSLSFAKANNSAIIFSFEPSPLTKRILDYNIKINNLEDKINTLAYALSDHLGKAVFFQTNDNAYSSLKDTQRKKVLRKIEVDLITIDEFVLRENIQRINLMKIDVEGLDTEVIKGGIATLKKFRPDIFIEIYQGVNSNPNPAETIALLKSLGYFGYLVINGARVEFESHSDKNYNYFFSFND